MATTKRSQGVELGANLNGGKGGRLNSRPPEYKSIALTNQDTCPSRYLSVTTTPLEMLKIFTLHSCFSISKSANNFLDAELENNSFKQIHSGYRNVSNQQDLSKCIARTLA